MRVSNPVFPCLCLISLLRYESSAYRAISLFLVKSDHRTLMIRHCNIVNSELHVVWKETNFHSLATFCVMTGAKYCAIHSTTSAATNTSTTLDGTLTSTYFDERMMYSVASSVFTGRCFGIGVFRVVSFIQPNSSGYFNSGGSLFSNEYHTHGGLVISSFNIHY